MEKHTKVIVSVGGNDVRSANAVAHQIRSCLEVLFSIPVIGHLDPLKQHERRQLLDQFSTINATLEIHTEPKFKASIKDAMAPILAYYSINEVLEALLAHARTQQALCIEENGEEDHGWKALEENVKATLDLVY